MGILTLNAKTTESLCDVYSTLLFTMINLALHSNSESDYHIL